MRTGIRRPPVCCALALIGWCSVQTALPAPSTYSEAIVRPLNEDFSSAGNELCFSFTGTGNASTCQGVHEFAGSTMNYYAYGQADYGVLRTSGLLGIERPSGPAGSGGPYQYRAQGYARFRDQWTITGQPGGTIGTIKFLMSVTGSYESMLWTGYGIGLSLRNITDNTLDSDIQLPSYVGELSTNFVFGTPLDFEISLLGSAHLSSLETGGYDGQFASMDLSSTAILTAIIVTNQDGSPVNYQLSTASGAALFDALASNDVPEPAGLLLVMLGFGLMPLVRYRK